MDDGQGCDPCNTWFETKAADQIYIEDFIMQSKHGKYLGESSVVENHGYTRDDFIMMTIEKYGGIYGDHHKAWVIDQIAQIMKGCDIEVRIRRWEDGHTETQFEVIPNLRYYNWIKEMKYGEDGPETYEYDQGIAP